jgi:hypothetical protein
MVIIMANAYDDLYVWLRVAYRGEPFTVSEFRAMFPSPAPAKVLFDLRRLGYIEAGSHGKYKVIGPDMRVQRTVERAERSFGVPAMAGLPYAYSRDTAVSIWTDGGYWTGFTRGFRPLHMNILKRDVNAWLSFFRSAGARATVEGTRETLFGVVHVLHPVARVHAVEHGGVRVVPKDEAHAFAASRPYAYEPVVLSLGSPSGRRGG